MDERNERERRAFYDGVYPLLYAEATGERTEPEIEHVLAFLRLPPGARVLDLCCADGRHSVRLAAKGLSVTGLDWSNELLDLARVRPGGAQVRWVRADARKLPFHEAFDAAVCLYNSMPFTDDDDTQAALSEAARALAPGGQLLLDVDHRDRCARDESLVRETRQVGDAVVHSERRFDAVRGLAETDIRIERGGQVSERFLRYRAYTATDWVRMAGQAGLTVTGLYGEYDRRPFTAASPSLLLHARTGYVEL